MKPILNYLPLLNDNGKDSQYPLLFIAAAINPDDFGYDKRPGSIIVECTCYVRETLLGTRFDTIFAANDINVQEQTPVSISFIALRKNSKDVSVPVGNTAHCILDFGEKKPVPKIFDRLVFRDKRYTPGESKNAPSMQTFLYLTQQPLYQKLKEISSQD